MRKRILSMIVLLAMSCAFFGCGANQGNDVNNSLSQDSNQSGEQNSNPETDQDNEEPKTYTISVLTQMTQYRDEYSYDSGNVSMVVKYQYNEAGYCILSQAQYDGSAEWVPFGEYKYNEKNQLIEFDEGFFHYRYEYDEKGQLYKTIELGTTEIHSIHEYDESGRLMKDTRDDGYWTEYAYSDQGNLEKKTCYNASGKVYMYEVYEYDENGNNIKVENYGTEGMNATTLYEYDEDGNCVSKVFTWYYTGTEDVDFITREFYEYETITVTR